MQVYVQYLVASGFAILVLSLGGAYGIVNANQYVFKLALSSAAIAYLSCLLALLRLALADDLPKPILLIMFGGEVVAGFMALGIGFMMLAVLR